VTVESTDTPFTAALASGDRLVIPVKHGEGNWVVGDDVYVDLVERGQIVLRYVDDVNGSRDRVAGVANEAGNVLGLMPHPEHAVDPLLGPTGGVPLLEGLIAAARDRSVEHALGL
jgi:phosphoribosylformylglycinamidine synthase